MCKGALKNGLKRGFKRALTGVFVRGPNIMAPAKISSAKYLSGNDVSLTFGA